VSIPLTDGHLDASLVEFLSSRSSDETSSKKEDLPKNLLVLVYKNVAVSKQGLAHLEEPKLAMIESKADMIGDI